MVQREKVTCSGSLCPLWAEPGLESGLLPLSLGLCPLGKAFILHALDYRCTCVYVCICMGARVHVFMIDMCMCICNILTYLYM